MYKEIINTSHKLSTKKYNKDMGNPKAFLTIPRQEAGYRPIHDRISDYSEVEQTLNSRDRKLQASRCMDCGVPFCHWACPLSNKQPEFQDPNLSPREQREKYTLYDNKAAFGAEAAEGLRALAQQLETIGYRISTDRGDYH